MGLNIYTELVSVVNIKRDHYVTKGDYMYI